MAPPACSDMRRPGAADVCAVIGANVSAHPDRVAVVDRGQAFTYRQLHEDVDRICGLLSRAGCGTGTRVCVAVHHGLALVSSILAVLRLGGTYVPVDARNPPERNRYIVDDSGCTLLLHSGEAGPFADRVGIPSLRVDGPADPGAAPPAGHAADPSPDALAYILYTSGSTGAPKGVGITRGNLMNYAAWASATYFRAASDRIALYTTVAFDFTVTCLFPPLMAGASIGVFDGVGDPMAIRDVLDDPDVNVVKITPSYLAVLAELLDGHAHLARLIVGGEDLKAALAERVTSLAGGAVEIINEYGPTEATVGCLYHRFDRRRDDGASVPIGLPIPGVRAFVLDDRGRPIDDGRVGELCVSGRSVSPGYVGANRSRRASFEGVGSGIPGPSYRTGDLVRRDETGAFHFLGRRDDQVKIRGNRVELAEVTSALMRVPGVKAAYATAVADDASHALLALATCEGAVSERSVLEHLRASLPPYMVPTLFRIVPRLPLTNNGKVDREAALSVFTAEAQGRWRPGAPPPARS